MASNVYDVIVVGAGLSGLQAALDIQQAGLKCLVLEARDRVGGKTLSLRSNISGQAVLKSELGAAWINDTNQSSMWKLAQELGLNTYQQNIIGDVVVQDTDGSLIKFQYGDVPKYPSVEDTASCIAIRDLVHEASVSQSPSIFLDGPHRQYLDTISFETYLREAKVTAKGFATAQVWTHAMVGCDPSEVSALYFLEYCAAGGGLMTMRGDGKHGGQYLRVREGTSAFAEGMAQKLIAGSLKLQSPVVSITQAASNGSVSVTTRSADTRTFQARRVIISVPTPVYKTIAFSPQLPPAKTAVTNRTRYGFYTKYNVTFRRPFWLDKNHCGLAQSFIGPISVIRDTSLDDGKTYCLTCFMGGKFGRKWAAQDAEGKKRSVLKQVADIFADGTDISDLFVEAFESPWMEEEYSGWGCPCPVTPPGVLAEAWDAMCAPFGNLHFVGTELSRVWRGYMEGAVRSGSSGAAETLLGLKATNPKL
ncbi:hypothetical protein LTR84_007920 [Exophiala bonariae]|uniref:Amine oxidase n=1 Tax=Exophiala bonariae TaxID=1690606 RepID=A0AAV9NMH1_9EURO|nr:hypothetical protein LTR84_007920 [Exophiala bonariae]